MLDSKGRLREAWMCTCFECGKEVVLSWEHGDDMSRSQAKHILHGEEYGWSEVDDAWVCRDCHEDRV